MFNSATFNSQQYNMSTFAIVLTIAALGIVTQLQTSGAITELGSIPNVTVVGTGSDVCQLQSA